MTGSRDWEDRDAVWARLDACLGLAREERRLMVVTHGACPSGADRHARDWVARRRLWWLGVEEDPRPADWARHGKRAGFLRNEEMVKLGPDVCLAFVNMCRLRGCARRPEHGTHGASHCVGLAEAAGIVTERIGWGL